MWTGEWHNVWKYSGHHLIDTVEHENIQCVGYKRGYSLMWCVRLQMFNIFFQLWLGGFDSITRLQIRSRYSVSADLNPWAEYFLFEV